MNTNTENQIELKEGYVLTLEGTQIPKDETYFCEFYQQETENETFKVYARNLYGVNWSYKAIRAYNDIERNPRLYHYEYEGESMYITRGELWRFSLVWLQDEQEIAHEDDAYLHSDGEYYSYEEEREAEYVRDYHSDSNTYFHHFSEKEKRSPFYIGYEIEKEDTDVKESINIDEFERIAPKWRKESDGSLNSESGYELISPCLELCPASIEQYIKTNRTLLEHVNADKSDSCGGHINVSERGKTGRELFETIQGYTPLFHALYYKRIDKGYSKGKSNEDIKCGDKYQSIRIHSNRVEIRIISAVPNLRTLIWRTRLIQYILNNQTSDPREAFVNFHDTELKALITEVYNTPEKLATLNERLIRYTRTFEHIDVVSEIWQEKETAQLAKAKNVNIQKAIEDNQQTLISQVLKNEEENEEEEEN